MKTTGNTILITGGASGIGLALAERFLSRGNQVIICGRRPDKLQQAKERLPALHIRVADIAVEADRLALCDWVSSEFPDLNVLINNAGIQQRVNLLDATAAWSHYREELLINQEAPIHLTMLLIPHLRQKQAAAIVNVTSGLAFVPAGWVPIYSATKAAMHSFTVSLRLQLAETPIEIIEIIPPAVNTDLGGVGLHTFGEPLDQFADAMFAGLDQGEAEIGYGFSKKAMHASRAEQDEIVKANWERMKDHK
ncbi:MAG: SDR family NAD(P)-dependent oxidoreductase [Negativicutes bacterium]|nr:SDR family NAD(P)-dependent oxidoreductase [Negativicutes bacterium]